LHFDLNRRFTTHLDVDNRNDRAVAVPVGNPEKQVADRAETGFGSSFGKFGANPLQRLQRNVKRTGAWPVDGSVA
jgi:hypothetical protein